MICDCTERKKTLRTGEIYRRFEVTTGAGRFDVGYYGKARGMEFITVNGALVHFERRRFWFMPLYEFDLGAERALLSVRVRPWLEVKSLYFLVGGELAYKEINDVDLTPQAPNAP